MSNAQGAALPANSLAGWLVTRLLDAANWSVNLLREAPRRSGRLAAVVVNSPATLERPDQVAAWLHALLSYLFDLFGGPEIVEFVIRLATDTRALTEEEISAAADVLGKNAIRYRDVRVARNGLLRYVFRLNNNRAFATWHTINMPDKAAQNLPLLVHELTHVFQYERVGSIYIGQGLWVQSQLGRKAYDYEGRDGLLRARAAGKRFRDYNREQQGQIAQDYCALLRDGKDTTAYQPFIRELRAGTL